MEKDRTLTPWLDTDLTDIPGEEWRDITGYDGLYQVSSYGRIKSLARYDMRGRRIRERIRRLNFHPNGAVIVTLQQDGKENSYAIMLLVGNAFLGKHPDQIYIHRNKNLLDNRVANIEVGSWAQSTRLDVALGKKTDRTATLVTFMKAKAAQHLDQFGVLAEGQLVAKQCPICLVTQPLTAYYKGLNKCKTCHLKARGVQAVGKQAAIQALGEQGLRKCNKCAQIKNLGEFRKNQKGSFGREHTCKACRQVASGLPTS